MSEALSQLHGTYGLAIMFRGVPDVIIAARRGSPLVVGVGNGEHYLASDPGRASWLHRSDRLSGRPRAGRVDGGLTCIYSLEQGVEGVVIIDGKTPHAVLLELFTNQGTGTLIHK